MSRILLLGAGRSASSLIHYLLQHAEANQWQVIVADASKETAEQKINNHPQAKAIALDASDEEQLVIAISRADVVISMLPATMHPEVGMICLNHGKHLFTASYVSPAMRELDEAARKKGLLFMNECGLDPGIDHITAMEIIDEIRGKGGEITMFKSFAGGLVAPEYDTNPWQYKFTWNPRNVVLAGQGTAKFIRNNQYKYIPYHQLFKRLEPVNVEGFGAFEAYPNRDSLSYRAPYGLENIPTILRGTLRRPGYSEAWNVFVQLGLTDDSFKIENSEEMTYRQFLNSFLAYSPTDMLEEKLCNYVGITRDSDIYKKIAWLGLFEERKIGLKNASPAQILQQILEEKWALADGDKDMIVMQHQFEYVLKGEKRSRISSMVCLGDDTLHTGMSKTVGWPLGIAVKLLLQGKVKARGVQLPITQEFYAPIITELKSLGISFIEDDRAI
ncbi:saccharopine dehydrogenase C-terminal domain-containing protein [Cytophagales bacterium LB-30]|uniref:Saccharopine dehydrogenase C-terminal domain-containing protein n=1 Tax=Shiella aurantiaca TaxID=3058365 RepID=A0ABT8F1H1_9BACT|nr:saccharopine dehydrogenase C-terminal domain-containing protein [Shiella aurantiaca]MDN4164293.1 saccharopine dehydrogenase C-terminal domain-containing protein [Shiella aurantiaca]